jgi:multiple sugar transport system permease protein
VGENGRHAAGWESRRAARRAHLLPWMLLAPVLILLLVVNIYPLVQAFRLSFTDYNLANVGTPESYVGLSNYQAALQDSSFIKSLSTTSIFVAGSLALEFVFGFGLALLLNRRIRFQAFFRTALVLPMMVSPLVVGLLWRFMYNYDTGIFNYLLRTAHLPQQNVLGTHSTALLAVITADVWQWTPLVFLLLFAGLQSLPTEPFESAQLDGASSLQILYHVTVPLLKPIIAIALILRGMDAVREYDKIYSMTGGGPGSATETVSYFIYRQGFMNLNLGYAAAAAMILLAIITVIVMVLVRTQVRLADAER